MKIPFNFYNCNVWLFCKKKENELMKTSMPCAKQIVPNVIRLCSARICIVSPLGFWLGSLRPYFGWWVVWDGFDGLFRTDFGDRLFQHDFRSGSFGHILFCIGCRWRLIPSVVSCITFKKMWTFTALVTVVAQMSIVGWCMCVFVGYLLLLWL